MQPADAVKSSNCSVDTKIGFLSLQHKATGLGRNLAVFRHYQKKARQFVWLWAAGFWGVGHSALPEDTYIRDFSPVREMSVTCGKQQGSWPYLPTGPVSQFYHHLIGGAERCHWHGTVTALLPWNIQLPRALLCTLQSRRPQPTRWWWTPLRLSFIPNLLPGQGVVSLPSDGKGWRPHGFPPSLFPGRPFHQLIGTTELPYQVCMGSMHP